MEQMVNEENNDERELTSSIGLKNDIFKLDKKELGEPVLSCININKIYKLSGGEEDVIALRNINLNEEDEFKSIKRGEFVIIRGPSGGGKTTLLNIIGIL
jgi:putative ABC transport system ATP-binding protein